MFDANMRYLSKGCTFFADVNICVEGTPLYKAGVREGGVVYCEMLDESEKNPRVKFFVEGTDVVVTDEEDSYDYWFVYAGNVKDGELHDFISDTSKNQAIKILKFA